MTNKTNASPVAPARCRVRQAENFVFERQSGGDGKYEFRNLRPGNYALKIDSATLPANFRQPAQTLWTVKIEPLREFYQDVPLTAQRAITSVVFIDVDGDGKYNAQKDAPVEGATIYADDCAAVFDRRGSYILRNLPAGQVKITVRSRHSAANSAVFLELGAEPETRRAVNLPVGR